MRFNTYHKTDYFGVGLEFAVQYVYTDSTHTTKRAAGIVLSLSLFTRVLEVGYWW